jgi:hypothetical protein
MAVTRADRHRHFQRERIAAAQTPEQRFAAAADWLRSSARKLGNRRDGSAAARDRVLNENADRLITAAEAIDRGEIP